MYIVLAELTPEHKRKISEWTPGDYSFSDHAFGRGVDRSTFPLGENEPPPELPTAVVRHLKLNGYKTKENHNGLTTGPDGREFRIGKVLEKTNAPDVVKRAYQLHRAALSSYDPNALRVTYSRNPNDVAGMSTGKGWTSCMDIDDPRGLEMYPKLKDDLHHGSHIAYLHHKDDVNIDHPLARMVLKPFVNGEGEKVLRPDEISYGIESPLFKRHIEKWTEKHFPLKKGIYKVPPSIYMDSLKRDYISDNASRRDIANNELSKRFSNLDSTIPHVEYLAKHHPQDLYQYPENYHAVNKMNDVEKLKDIYKTKTKSSHVLNKIAKKGTTDDLLELASHEIANGRSIDEIYNHIPKKERIRNLILDSEYPTNHYTHLLTKPDQDKRIRAFIKRSAKGPLDRKGLPWDVLKNRDYSSWIKTPESPDHIRMAMQYGDKKTHKAIAKYHPNFASITGQMHKHADISKSLVESNPNSLVALQISAHYHPHLLAYYKNHPNPKIREHSKYTGKS